MKGCALGLALKKRHKTTQKWPLLQVESVLGYSAPDTGWSYPASMFPPGGGSDRDARRLA